MGPPPPSTVRLPAQPACLTSESVGDGQNLEQPQLHRCRSGFCWPVRTPLIKSIIKAMPGLIRLSAQ